MHLADIIAFQLFYRRHRFQTQVRIKKLACHACKIHRYNLHR